MKIATFDQFVNEAFIRPDQNQRWNQRPKKMNYYERNRKI
jgi:hypothetical protein